MKKPKTDKELEEQTKKWLAKLETEMKRVKITNKLDKKAIEEAIENVHAYIDDCKHFHKKGDLVRAFEAVMYAWGILDTLQRCHLIIKKTDI